MSSFEQQQQTSELTPNLNQGINNALRWLYDNQQEDGFWFGQLESNSCMEAQWVLAQHIMGVGKDEKFDSVVQSIVSEQREDGSWEIYYDAPHGDVNTTVECYAALRVADYPKDHPVLRKALQWIIDNNAMRRLRVFTRYWLSLIGEWKWESCPALPPELILFPSWMPMNIYQFAQWGRGTIVPLLVLSARQHVVPLPEHQKLDELFPEGREKFNYKIKPDVKFLSIANFFVQMDKVLNLYIKSPIKPMRELAIKTCLEWMIKHQDWDGAWGGIQPPWIYSLMALKCEGYALDHPVVFKGLDAFNDHWRIDREGKGTYLQASESPIWDTVLTLLAMLECGIDPSEDAAMMRAIDWVLKKEIRVKGDWSIIVKNVEPSGWAFERANKLYPDTDDTGVAVLVLAKAKKFLNDEYNQRIDGAIERAVNWLRAMQCKNGGWGAFDRDNNKALVTKIPFCDFGEVLDPPSVDVTCHIIEAFAELGFKPSNDLAMQRAVRYVKLEQEKEGSWFGRWGVNHVYGTGAVLPALKAAGEDMSQAYVRRACEWLLGKQNDDGGWGETCASYMDDSLRGVGPSTASQTGWALMALVATDETLYKDAIKKGISYLLRAQKNNTWDEPYYTGTGFPGYGIGKRKDISRIMAKKKDFLTQGKELARGFMINYNMYRHYFPLTAMGRVREALGG